MKFHIERVTAKIGHTGPFLQYNHSRLCSMIDFNEDVKLVREVNFDLLIEPEATDLITNLAKYSSSLHFSDSCL